MQYRRIFTWFVSLAVLLAALPGVASAAPASQQSANLLTNPGFEGDFVTQSNNVQVASGWTAWWISRQEGEPDWKNQQPNFESSTHPDRVHGGAKSQILSSFFATHTAGVYQSVNVKAGADLRFSAFGKGWTSTNDDPLNTSIAGTDLRMRIGVDPFGGSDPNSSNVVWSGQVNAADSWVRFEVNVRAQSSTVTVFLYSSPFDARRHNSVFWDDAELVALSGDAAATAQAGYPTPTPLPILPTPTPITLAIGQNLLTNPGFEGAWYTPCSWKSDLPWNHIPCDPWYKELMTRWNTVQTPDGWTAWWQIPITDTARSDYFTYPVACDRKSGAPEGCVPWHNPEYGGTDWIRNGPLRIRSGRNSLKYFTFWSVHQGGMFQTVSGIAPGTVLRFSAYMHAWSATQTQGGAEPSPFTSQGQTSMHMKIGVDPAGGRNPWSGDIVWSPEFDSYDQWGYYQITATAISDKVTVFIHSRPEKDLKHNDLYVDDTELVAVSIPPGAAPPANGSKAPTQSSAPPRPPAAPASTSTPHPDGSIVHQVQSGDTLWAIALQYGVSMEQLLRLNGIAEDVFLQVGQELVIALPGESTAPTSELTAAPTDAPALVPTESAVPEVAAVNSGKLCVRAYSDANDDGAYNPGENLAAGVVFILQAADGAVAATRTTDGLTEPYCFEQTPGNYSMLIQVPAGRKATSDTRWGLALAPGAQIDIDFGSRLDANSVANVTAGASGESGAGRVLGGIVGVALLLLAGLLVGRIVTRGRLA